MDATRHGRHSGLGQRCAGWPYPQEERGTRGSFDELRNAGLDVDRVRFASNDKLPGPARNDPALIPGGIGTASGAVTPEPARPARCVSIAKNLLSLSDCCEDLGQTAPGCYWGGR